MTRYWLIWGLISFLTFVIPETVVLFLGHPERTLSDTLWRGERLAGANPLHWSFLHLIVVVTLVWLIGHFGWGLWR